MRWLVIAEWRRMVVGLVRYPIDTIASTLTLFLVFAGLFYGARYITSSPIGGGRLSTVVLGYTVWIVMMAATGDMAWSVQNEAQNGTLEQVMMVPWNAVWVFFVRAVMAIVGMLVPVGAVLVALLAMTHVHLAWRSAALVPMAMVIGTAWGLGLLVAGVALLLKRVGQVLQIVQFLLLFVIVSPVAVLPGIGWHLAAMAIPFAAQVFLLHGLLTSGATATIWLWVESLFNLLFMLASGILLFMGADRLARRQGILGHY